jgi:hypothetical protein
VNIPIPGIMFECGSNPNGRHGLRGELTHSQKGPRWFRDNRIDPMLEGNPAVFLHRWFGEYTRGDHQDFNAISQLKNGLSISDREYAYYALKELYQLSISESDIFVYMGSFKSNWFRSLLNRMRFDQWSEEIMEEIGWYLWGGDDYHHVFDHASSYKKNSIHWRMLKLIERKLKNPIHIEATPLPESTHQDGYPSFVNEIRYWQTTERITSKMVKAGVTRWLNKSALQVIWEDDAVAFVLDCHAKGHKCFIADTAYNHLKLTPKTLQEKAEKTL